MCFTIILLEIAEKESIKEMYPTWRWQFD